MLSGENSAAISAKVMSSRVELKLKPEDLAGKAAVGARFVRSVEGQKLQRWEMAHLVMLLRMLVILKLPEEVAMIQAVMQASPKGKWERRRRDGRRDGGKTFSRREVAFRR